MLDYDGTLREIMRTPEEAAPTLEILELLSPMLVERLEQMVEAERNPGEAVAEHHAADKRRDKSIASDQLRHDVSERGE